MSLRLKNKLMVFIFLVFTECIRCLKLLELQVPTHVTRGARAHLSCLWELGPTETLYSVKWYKDGKEFFRHVPRNQEPQRKFKLPGVEVENSDPSGSNLTLSPTCLESSGRYRCEVSGEKPLFPTVTNHADMEVIVSHDMTLDFKMKEAWHLFLIKNPDVIKLYYLSKIGLVNIKKFHVNVVVALVLPDHGPVISGFHAKYKTGDRVLVNCTSGSSWPATHLVWYINGEPASPAAVSAPIIVVDDHGLKITNLTLDFKITERLFNDSRIKIKCLATLFPLYWRSNEASALKQRESIYKTPEEDIPKIVTNKYVTKYQVRSLRNFVPELIIASKTMIALIVILYFH